MIITCFFLYKFWITPMDRFIQVRRAKARPY